MGFEPVGSGVGLVVGVMGGLPLGSGLGLGGWGCEVLYSVWVVLESAVIWSGVVLWDLAVDFEMCGQKILLAPVSQCLIWCMRCSGE